MYEAFFQLKQRPFAAAPQPGRYFPAQSAEAAYHALVRCVDRAEGPGILIGGAGTGKSLLMEMLARRFADRFTVAMLASGAFSTRRELLQAILYELQLPYRGMDEGELRLALFQHLNPNPDCPAGVLLLADEAQRLPLRLLEELRILGDYARDGQPRVRLIMAGTRSLEERLASPKLDSLAQRLAVRSYLSPLERGETAAYVRSHIAALGGHADQIFTPDALEAIQQATDGIPRLINQLGDHALVLAYAGGRRQIGRSQIEEAWADLQQLPAPWNESEEEISLGEANLIEFGELDDGELGDGDEPEALPFTMQQLLSDGPSPMVKLDELTAQLASLEDEFDLAEPSEAMPPLAHCNPFAETFLEEEVVLDRYALADASLSDYQAVSSIEGSMISSLLEPYMHTQSRPQLSVASEAVDGLHSVTIAAPAPRNPTLDEGGGWTSGYSLKQSAAMAEVLQQNWPADMVHSSHCKSGGCESGECETNDYGTNDRETVAAHGEPIIVVENDPELPQPSGIQPMARRQEYRQLFAKLRRS